MILVLSVGHCGLFLSHTSRLNSSPDAKLGLVNGFRSLAPKLNHVSSVRLRSPKWDTFLSHLSVPRTLRAAFFFGGTAPNRDREDCAQEPSMEVVKGSTGSKEIDHLAVVVNTNGIPFWLRLVNSPPDLEPILVGIGMFSGGYDLDFDP